MSDIIHLLPDSVANQIAAGEVVQRPASVVKELVENAVDAGAKHIDVLVTEAGKASIQVIDDGKGMSETDARMAFERHATSKISTADDLFKLHTMGFRGEALASIAAVAQVELKTRRPEDEVGVSITLEGGKVTGQEPVSTTAGSNFTVRNLFFNVPARRKFLKSNQTELSNILQEFERIVLVHPDISFKFYHNGTEVFNLPHTHLRQRIMGVFGKKLNEQLLNVNVSTSIVTITGYTAKPEAARKKGAHQYFFVNDRFMKHPYFNHAVMDAYERLVPENEKISYFLYLKVDPSTIDVNIHPTKTEIKFNNDQMIWQIMNAAVKETLGKSNAMPMLDFDTEGKPDIPAFDPTAAIGGGMPKSGFNPNYNPFDTTPERDYVPDFHKSSASTASWNKLYDGLKAVTPAGGVQESYADEADEEEGVLSSRLNTEGSAIYEDQPPVGDRLEQESGLFSDGESGAKSVPEILHYQYNNRFILTSVKSGLMIIDQHRAHIRILYDDYMRRFEDKTHPSQRVLFPEMMTVPASEAVIMDSILPDLTQIGFDLSPLGGGSYSINGVPAGTENQKATGLLQSMLDAAREKGKDFKDEVHSLIALKMAEAGAIPVGKTLNNESMSKLVDELFISPTPNYTPDGRLILSILPQEDIDKLFK